VFPASMIIAHVNLA